MTNNFLNKNNSSSNPPALRCGLKKTGLFILKILVALLFVTIMYFDSASNIILAYLADDWSTVVWGMALLLPFLLFVVFKKFGE